jgi:hypothetical protein
MAPLLSRPKLLAKDPVMVSCVNSLDHQRYRHLTEILEDIFPEQGGPLPTKSCRKSGTFDSERDSYREPGAGDCRARSAKD